MTYDEVTDRLLITRCDDCPIGDHIAGWANMSTGVVHWRDRKLQRRGLRTYLKLVASILYSHNRGQPIWLQLYQQNTWAYRTALHEFRVRLRSSYADNDRARALYNARDASLSSKDPAYRWMKKEEI